ncbi:hypothetical protein [Microbulbifer sp. VAAF005]|uniref:hypothetical protein n=1 Tax=Microbulbifer sp. VAAF005 TaxID=3034230 RepID=UPI0024AE5120|nr:hypothetical protein [Microbulbifer sp. VAAF005]WHI45585.1 hypothetical protein P0078_17900 [Microbulbifer sp. VAAF005]
MGGGTLQMIIQRRDLKKYGLQSLFIPEQLAVILLDDFEKIMKSGIESGAKTIIM